MRLRSILLAVGVLAMPIGCSTTRPATPEPAAPDYARPLRPGASALRLITNPADMPDVGRAWRHRDAFLLDAIDESLVWFQAPSSRRYFPFEGITHQQARASLLAMIDLLENARSEDEFIDEVRQQFDVYQSVGYDGRGVVLFTGYYAPEFPASRTPTSRFRVPLYARPADLVTNPVTGEPKGRQTDGGEIVPYYTRREIEESNLLAGTELVWLEDHLSAYIVHVNGSARLRMEDGSLMYIGYAGKTDQPYASLGEAMIDAGLASRNDMTLSKIKSTYRKHPERVRELMYNNRNFVFFTEYAGGGWPAGSLGVKVTPETSLATDKKIYPRGGVVLVDTQAVTLSRGKQSFLRFMLDQDTGGAIKAPGRADIYMGEGATAEILAGGQHAEGSLYYFFLKPQYISLYIDGEGGTESQHALQRVE